MTRWLIALPPSGQTLWTCAIVVVLTVLASVTSGQDLRAEKIHGWDFQRSDDRNADLEPDGWRRRRDRAHPAYIEMKIASRDPARAAAAIEEQMLLARLLHAFQSGGWDGKYVPEVMPRSMSRLMDDYVLNNCLEIRMDGGAAELVSPVFPMDARFSYSLEAEVSCQGLDGHQAWIELQLLDGEQQLLDSARTKAITGTIDWTQTMTSIASDASNALKWGRVHLKVDPHDHMLIAGLARFDSIHIHRLPRLSLTTALTHHIAAPGEAFEVECTAMGINGDCGSVKFQLRDVHRDLLQEASVELEPDYPTPATIPPGRLVAKQPSRPAPAASQRPSKLDNFDGTATWKLKLDTPGLYRVSVFLGEAGAVQQRELLIGVIAPRPPLRAGPFGWSISGFHAGLRPEQLPSLVENYGAGWIKFPVWFESSDTSTADRLVAMTERLQALGCECVGVLDSPPVQQRSVFGDGMEQLPAVEIFRNHSEWEPLLEPVLTRMGLKLDWFQLGADGDTSFMDIANMESTLTDIRARMQTYCQELRLALNWTWLDAENEENVIPWNAVQYRTTPQLTATELLAYSASHANRRTSPWVTLDPLPAGRYTLRDRVRDLTERMIAVKRAAVPAAFVLNPFDAETGLFDEQQNVGEMLIPWQSLVDAIGVAEYRGTIKLPGGSVNHIFQVDDEGVIVMWNDLPQKEQMYFGETVTASDIWGKSIHVENTRSARGTSEQSFEVGTSPIIVRGIDIAVMRWLQSFEVLENNLVSSIGGEHTLPLRITNTLEQSAVGTLTMVSESLLRNGKSELPVQLSKGTPLERSLPFNLRPDASAGQHELRFDFDVTADRPYHFSIYRTITLGMGDIEFEWDMTRESPNMVKLRCELINNTGREVNFDCKFFPLGQPYQRFQILEAGSGSTLREFDMRLTREQEAAQAWIRCEEIGNGRVLNYRLGGE
ncbi:MAG: hypothetical protein R3C53_03125 [Pirellulaceae bacterium]